MFAFFPKIYPEENFHGLIGRYHYYSGGLTALGTIKETLGKNRSSCGVEVPMGVEFFANKYEFYNSNYFIYNHTLLPLFLPFLSSDQQKKIIDRVKYGELGVYTKLGLGTKNLKVKSGIAYCPICIKEDEDKYQEAYFHRIHQMPNILTCPEHGCYLEEYPIGTVRKNRCFVEFDCEKVNFFPIYETNPYIRDNLELIGKIAMELLTERGNLNIDIIFQKYLTFLRKKGFVWDRGKFNGEIKQSYLFDQISKYYGHLLFNKLGISLSDFSIWLKHKFIHMNPINHILLINFLAGSLESFLNN